MTKSQLLTAVVLTVILVVAFLLRIINLTTIPPALNWDEVSHGWNAYSILKTGKDEWGVSFPTIFRAYGDYKLPVYIYATALSEAVFGLTSFAVRLPSVLAGVATVLFTFLLTKKLFGRRVGLIAALLVAVEPWSSFLSRPAFEANFALMLIVSGVHFFLLGIEKVKFLPVSATLLGLAVWTYNSARIFVPLLLVLFAVLYRKELFSLWNTSRRLFTSSLLLITFFFLPMFWQLANPQGQARYVWVAILDEGAIHEINQARGASRLPAVLARLAHNKVTYFVPKFAANWLSHFSPEFLFLGGGSQFHFSIPGHGLLYAINAPFILAGFIYLSKKRSRTSWIILGWIILAPVASSLTREAPHVLRSIIILPIPMVLTSVGLVAAWDRVKNSKYKHSLSSNQIANIKYILVTIYLFLLGWSVGGYLMKYFDEYKKNYSWSWQYGYKEVVQYVKQNYDKYDQIVVTKKYGEPHEFFLFYWRWDPEKYQNDPNLIRFFQTNWYWVDRFDKFYFVNDWGIPRVEDGNWKLESGQEIEIDGRALLVTSPGNYPPGWRKLKTIDFLDGKAAFDILEQI